MQDLYTIVLEESGQPRVQRLQNEYTGRSENLPEKLLVKLARAGPPWIVALVAEPVQAMTALVTPVA